MSRWTQESRDRAKALWLTNVAATDIASTLAIEFGLQATKNSVIGQMFRAGLSGKGPRPGATNVPPGRAELPPSGRPRRADMTPEQLEAARAYERAVHAAKRDGTPMPTRPAVLRQGRARTVRIVTVATRREPAAPAPTPLVKPVAIRRDVELSLRIPIWEARAEQCRFIADEPDSRATYCGHEVLAGSPWCPGHHRLCTVPARSRAVSDYRRAA